MKHIIRKDINSLAWIVVWWEYMQNRYFYNAKVKYTFIQILWSIVTVNS